MNKVVGTAVAVGIGLLVASGAVGAEDAPQGASRFAAADTDQDGQISYEEFLAAHEQRIRRRFEAIDADGDGWLNQDELVAAREAKQQGEPAAP